MPRCLIVGECMLELSSSDHSTLHKSFAGDTFNTAVYLKRCLPECDVSFMTAIGMDTVSKQMECFIEASGINTRYVYRSPHKTVGLYMSSVDEAGERSFTYWRNDSATRHLLRLGALPAIRFDYLYLSGISLAILDSVQRTVLLDYVAASRKRGCRFVFDPNYRPQLWDSLHEARTWIDRAYELADIAFPGVDDHLSLYGHQDSDAILNYLSSFEIDEIVLKNGADAVQIQTAQERLTVPVIPVEQVVDTTSAGDAFIGGYLAATMQGYDQTDSAHFAAMVAGFVIGVQGAIVNKDLFSSQVPALSPQAGMQYAVA